MNSRRFARGHVRLALLVAAALAGFLAPHGIRADGRYGVRKGVRPGIPSVYGGTHRPFRGFVSGTIGPRHDPYAFYDRSEYAACANGYGRAYGSVCDFGGYTETRSSWSRRVTRGYGFRYGGPAYGYGCGGPGYGDGNGYGYGYGYDYGYGGGPVVTAGPYYGGVAGLYGPGGYYGYIRGQGGYYRGAVRIPHAYVITLPVDTSVPWRVEMQQRLEAARLDAAGGATPGAGAKGSAAAPSGSNAPPDASGAGASAAPPERSTTPQLPQADDLDTSPGAGSRRGFLYYPDTGQIVDGSLRAPVTSRAAPVETPPETRPATRPARVVLPRSEGSSARGGSAVPAEAIVGSRPVVSSRLQPRH